MSSLAVPVFTVAGSAISATLHPVLPGSLLAFLAYGPPHLVERLLRFDVMGHSLRGNGTTTVLRVLLGLGLVKTLNSMMSTWATTNWRVTPMRGWQWNREIAVVTGGCSGIGKSIVLGLVKKGVIVAILDVMPLPPDLEQERNINYWKCDITSAAAVAETATAIRKTLGHPSILVNNAGIAKPHSIVQTPDDYLQKIIAVNLMSLWITTKEFLPNMIIKNKGHIVTVASMASFTGMSLMADYTATKAGALAFYESLATEVKSVYKSPGVLASIVHPAYVSTNMTAQSAASLEKQSGGLMKPEDISNPVVKQIFSRRGGQIIIPGRLSFLSAVRGWPSWLQELIKESLPKP
ncbi:Dehydrogenase RED2 like protein [Verticillium longisporum]|uniref:Short-chain dehydrogenase/reductase 3 n=3 Tax=Verticillium TaxID=1036719 RepID=G2X5G3_VERDV|nr:estradiol 17-beta-dehydrogenase [Verticillium dahliae VdLs.17]KAF3342963.1 Protein EFR3 [Verticillium dahliae VDG2]KAG7113415.1 Dehydrogenase RED2 like protein [Verticillium longisporum]KAH6701043.1 estradiol 17-beta-dehydrogenase [Verticillium dahliae]EGY14304.1 estradiol 17-beta-dehydrogenase [Verticillium dahliae VdLs.17]PNH27252.1 hypothetical protein BJF96_g9434 [Verticillium dahliae]